MTKKTTLKIPGKNQVCSIFFSNKKLDLKKQLGNLSKNYSSVFLVTDTNVFKAQSDFFSEFPQENQFVFPAGESFKTLPTLFSITEKMAEREIDRKSLLIGIGGGVTTDIAAFVGNIYQRGIETILIPTSLLGMVDAGIGGKTGVDTPWGKNQLGTFYWPNSVHICTEFLETLPEAEIRNGLAEMIKHGIIASEKHFSTLENLISSKFSWENIAPFIPDSVQIKINIVEKDAQEKENERIKLNLGHTFAHAIEIDSKFTIPHGQAVAIGLRLAAEFGVELKITDAAVKNRIVSVVKKLFPKKNSYPVKTLWKHMKLDKKRNGAHINLVLPKIIGAVNLKSMLINDIIK